VLNLGCLVGSDYFSIILMLQSILMKMMSCLLTLLSLRELGILVSIVMVLGALVKVLYAPLVAGKGKSPPQLNMPAREVTREFFGKRFEFIRDGFKATSSSIYQIPLFGRKAIVLSGPEGRRIFTKEKGLNIYDSFSLLMGSVSRPPCPGDDGTPTDSLIECSIQPSSH
jgi:sterol 14-demethylase